MPAGITYGVCASSPSRNPQWIQTNPNRSPLTNVRFDPFVVVLFVTRKYPPARGGMEEFSQRLFDHYPGEKRLIALRRGQRWLPVWLAGAILKSALVTPRPTVVHLGDAMLTPLAPAIRLLTGAKVVATVHGQDVTRDVAPYQWIVSRTLRSVGQGLVAVSSYTAAEVCRRAGVRPTVIHNGVDADRFSAIKRAEDPTTARVALGLPPHGLLIVSVGRLVERKGVCWFAREVLPGLGPDATFAVVGDGPEREELQEVARDEPRIRWLGQAPDQGVDALYACADLFVAPNVVVPGRPEGFGIAPAEAAAAGLPVLAAGIEGLRDMAEVAGATLLPSGEADAWVEAIISGQWAHAVSPRHVRDWDDVARDYKRFFESVSMDARRRMES